MLPRFLSEWSVLKAFDHLSGSNIAEIVTIGPGNTTMAEQQQPNPVGIQGATAGIKHYRFQFEGLYSSHQ